MRVILQSASVCLYNKIFICIVSEKRTMGSMATFPGPTPPYTNPPIEPQYFEPSRFVISNITKAVQATVTTTTPYNYVIGQEVRFVVSPRYGMYQINEQTAFVVSTPTSTTFVAAINTLPFSTFITSPSPTPINKPQVLAIGDINSGGQNGTGRTNNPTTISGSFQNISPL